MVSSQVMPQRRTYQSPTITQGQAAPEQGDWCKCHIMATKGAVDA